MEIFGSKIAEIEIEIDLYMKELKLLENKIATLKSEKKTPKSHLVLQEIVEDAKEAIRKHSEELEDINFTYEQRIISLNKER